MERRAIDASEGDLGLSLSEGKSLLKQIRRELLQDQIEEISEVAQVCRFCGTYLPIHDRRRRPRRLTTGGDRPSIEQIIGR